MNEIAAQRLELSHCAIFQKHNTLMGCDIHCYVEYKHSGTDKDWSPFGGRINPGRNYHLFGRLAGVRGGGPSIAAPRGMPSDAAYYAKCDNRIWISEKGSENTVPLETAKHYAKRGCEITCFDGKPTWVTHPDWHSHSWLNADEFSQALGDTGEPEYRAILAAMRSLEDSGYDVRVVFWFDN